MFDIGWSEMAVVALVALLIIGPKDLPKAMRTLSQWVRKAKAMTREFQSGIDDMIRESELDEARKAIDSVSSTSIENSIADTVDPTGSVKESLSDVEKTAASTTTDSQAKSGPSANPLPGGGFRAKSDETPSSTAGANSESDSPDSDGGEAEQAAPLSEVVQNPASVAPPHSISQPAEPAAADAGASATDGRKAGQGG